MDSLFAQLFENANDAIFVLDRQARFVAVNQKFAEIVGMPREEIIGKTTETFLPGRFAQSLERLERTIQEGRFGPYELGITTPLGQKVFSLNAFAYFEGETPVGVINIAHDITEELRQKQEALYQLAHALARSLDIRAIADRLFALTHNLLGTDYGFLMLANAEGTELRGVAAYGMDSETFHQERIQTKEEFAPAALAFHKKQLVMIADVGSSPLVGERLREKYHFVKSACIVPLISGEKAVGIFAVGYASQREVTPEELQSLQLLGDEAASAIERALLTEALRESEERYRSLFENANDAIVSGTLDGTITNVNRRLEKMLGWSREELIGQHYLKIVTPASAALGEERTRRALAGEKLPPIFEAEMVRKDGSVVPVEIRDRFIRDKEGKPIGWQGIYRDISAKKELERRRADFLAMLTHDIKNPLGAILGYAGMLREMGGLSQEQENIVHRQEINVQKVLSLVDNYLDLSRIEAGRLVLLKKLLAVNDILRQVGQQYEAEAHHRQIALEFYLQEELPAVEGDLLALERVFANLVYNALKYTPKLGRVTVSSAWQDGAAVVAVADTGPGIAPEEIPFIFEKYRRAAADRHRRDVGLGLFIVKTLVEAHGGRIEVESTLGQGSCFSVYLPWVSADRTEA